MSRVTVYNWFKDKPQFKQAYDDIEESIIDLTESQLLNLIKGIPKFETDEWGAKKFVGWVERPSEAAIFFKLKTKAKNRGYVERSEVTGNNGRPIYLFSEIERQDDPGEETNNGV